MEHPMKQRIKNELFFKYLDISLKYNKILLEKLKACSRSHIFSWDPLRCKSLIEILRIRFNILEVIEGMLGLIVVKMDKALHTVFVLM